MNTRPSTQASDSSEQFAISSSAESEIDAFLSEDLNVRVEHLAEEHTFILLGAMANGFRESAPDISNEGDMPLSFHEELADDVKKSVPDIGRISKRLSLSRWVLLGSVLAFVIPITMIIQGWVVSANDQYIVGLLFVFLLLSTSVTCLTMLGLSLIKEHYYQSVAKAALVKCANDTRKKNSVSLDIDKVIEDVQRAIVSDTIDNSQNAREILATSVLERLRSIKTRTC